MSEEEDSLQTLASKNILNSILDSFGWGKFQNIVLLIIGIAFLADGAEVTLLSILSSILEDVWGLDTLHLWILTGVIFCGQIIGNILVSIWGDDFGRVQLLKVSSLVLFSFGLLSAAMPEFWSFVVFRMLTGIGIGFLGAVSTAYATESTPMNQRGFMMMLGWSFFNLGQIYVALIALAVVPDLDPTYWRLLVALTAVPVALFIAIVFMYPIETPYFLAVHELYDQAIETLNKIATLNSKPELSEEEKALLTEVPFKYEGVGLNRIRILFDDEKCLSSSLLIPFWFSAIFSYYGFLYLVPKTIGADHGNLVILVVLMMGIVQILGQFVGIYTIELKSIGRKHTMSICIFGQLLAALVSMLLIGSWYFLIPVSFFVAFACIWTNVIWIYTAELYETRVRATALCFFNIFGRLGGVVGPGLLYLLDTENKEAPYLCVVGVSVATLAICLLLPFETRDKGLDTHNQ